jgi:hypothetical protein
LKKLQTNKQWLEESLKKVKEYESQPETQGFSQTEAEEWVNKNRDVVLEYMGNPDNTVFSNHWNQDFAENGRFNILIDLKYIPSFPFYNNKRKEDLSMKKLSGAIKSAFISTTTSHGKTIPSRYQAINQYIILFEGSTDEFIDAKFYGEVPTLLSNFEEQYNLAGTID